MILPIKTFLWLYKALGQRTIMLIKLTSPGKSRLFLLSKLLFSCIILYLCSHNSLYHHYIPHTMYNFSSRHNYPFLCWFPRFLKLLVYRTVFCKLFLSIFPLYLQLVNPTQLLGFSLDFNSTKKTI